MAAGTLLPVLLGSVGGAGGLVGITAMWRFFAVEKPAAAVAEAERLWARLDLLQTQADAVRAKVIECERREAQWERRYGLQEIELARLREQVEIWQRGITG